MAKAMPDDVAAFLANASTPPVKTAAKQFVSNICGNEWDRFIEVWAAKSYHFVGQALGPYQKEPLPEILPLEDGAHSAGANASFEPATGQIRLSPSVVMGKPGTTLEKITHELIHASLNDFPEGDCFYEEGQVDYSTWVVAHAPYWGIYREAMIEAADFNIRCRYDRAIRSQTDYDRKRWAGGIHAATAFGPWIVTRLRQKKMEGDLSW